MRPFFNIPRKFSLRNAPFYRSAKVFSLESFLLYSMYLFVCMCVCMHVQIYVYMNMSCTCMYVSVYVSTFYTLIVAWCQHWREGTSPIAALHWTEDAGDWCLCLSVSILGELYSQQVAVVTPDCQAAQFCMVCVCMKSRVAWRMNFLLHENNNLLLLSCSEWVCDGGLDWSAGVRWYGRQALWSHLTSSDQHGHGESRVKFSRNIRIWW